MGVIIIAKIIILLYRAGRPKRLQPENRTWVIIIEGVNSYGGTILLIIVFKSKIQ